MKKLDQKKTQTNEEIELIDIDREEVVTIEKKVTRKRKLKKALLFQTVFCSISIIFIIGCCIFYGARLIKYYKIYNPKDENGKAVQLLGNYITGKSTLVYEGEGLYVSGGNYVYKGNEVNNYVKFANMLWRILKVNTDGTVDIILDRSINNLKWNKEITDYSSSDINSYLNKVFLSYLNKNLITNTLVCKDIIDNVEQIKCNDPDASNFVRLLTVDEFLNSQVDDESFVSNGNNIWLSSRGSTAAWAINNNNISYATVDNAYNIKPVLTLKNSNSILSGDGTKENPFILEKEKNGIKVGDYVKLDNDIWTVYATENDNIRLSLTSLYADGNKTYRFDLSSNKYDPSRKSSLAKYLNEEFYNELSYKDMLVDVEWYTGSYKDSYEDIYAEKITAKVGISNVVDLKLDDVTNYYLMNGATDNKVYLYKDVLIESKVTLSRSIKPSICIKKQTAKSGDGSLANPYVLEG